MGWLVPYTKLDDQQKEFVDDIDIDKQNVWIKGFPGSGKSILLAYTFKRIKQTKPNASIVVIVFTHSLISMFKAAFAEMGQNANIQTYIQFRKTNEHYDYILCDEVQDLTNSILRGMNNRADHVIVAGDENQSIYECDPQTQESTVRPSEINNLLGSYEFRLNFIHRLSSSIINVVNKFLPKLNLFTSKVDLTKENVQVRLCEAHNFNEEVQYIYREGKKAIYIDETAAVLIPTQKTIINFINSILSIEGKPEWQTQLNQYGKPDYNLLNKYLEKYNIPIQYVGNGYGSFNKANKKIVIMTYHSSKGLDFDHVFLPGLNNSLFITYDEHLSKTLFMVAMTRSRKNLYITFNGYQHPYINNFISECHNLDIHDSLTADNVSSNNIFNKNNDLFGGI